MNIEQLKIIGCGGHCKVVLDVLSLLNTKLSISLYDSNPELSGKKVNGISINCLPELLTSFSGPIHIAIGSNKIREKLANLFNSDTSFFTIIHPAAILSRSANIGSGTLITAGSILGPECVIGKGCIINHGAIVDHEVKVGDFSHIAPNSTLGGNVTVGRGVLIGAGAVILPGINIGDEAIVGAGAVVIKDVKSKSIVMGVPAVTKE